MDDTLTKYVTKDVTLSNELGLHARAAAAFVKCATKYNCEVTIKRNDIEVNGKSIMGVMMLAIPCGQSFCISAEGDDAHHAVEDLANLVDAKFGEAQ